MSHFLLYLAALGYELIQRVGRVLAIFFSVYVDPRQASWRPVPLWGPPSNKYTSVRVILGSTERERRFVAWLYRNFDAPTAGDISSGMWWARLQQLPYFGLLFEGPGVERRSLFVANLAPAFASCVLRGSSSTQQVAYRAGMRGFAAASMLAAYDKAAGAEAAAADPKLRT